MTVFSLDNLELHGHFYYFTQPSSFVRLAKIRIVRNNNNLYMNMCHYKK